ncbi:uncharacterized protein LOC120841717 [Ixodes scapularis]|uniref:uncharacterized protein LOC120841717 n=1 Tax=Ixodes scapularis TaxID=6945 RepID=UPI001A9DD210|nr:uncharacterized protein LOC120841717 [Ixodes scapularis]
MSEEAGTHFAGRMGYLEPFDESSSDWASYDERLTSFLIVNGVPESDKVHAFLSIISPKTYALLKSLTAPELPSTKSFEYLKKALGDHLSPKPSIIDSKLTFQKAVERAQAMEAAKQSAAEARVGNSSVTDVHKVQAGNEKQRDSCYHCGSSRHRSQECPHRQSVCHKCGKKGHIQRVCRSGTDVGGKKRPPGERQMFLQSYRNTAHATTNESPANLFLGRRLRSRLDVVKPSVGERVARKQFMQTASRRGHDRDFAVGDHVLIRNYCGKPKWVPGVILAQHGPVSYQARATTPRGSFTWRRHKDQLLRTPSLADEDADQEGTEFLLVQPSDNAPQPSSSSPTGGTVPAEAAQAPAARRYPARTRKPHERFQAGS